MRVISPTSSTGSCRQFLLHFLLLCLLVVGPTRATSYRVSLQGPRPANSVLRQQHQHHQHQQPVDQYYSHGSNLVSAIEASKSSPHRPRSAWISARPTAEQRVARAQPTYENVADGAVGFGPMTVGEWTSRNSVSKTDARASMASLSGLPVKAQNIRKRVVETADLSFGGDGRGQAKAKAAKRPRTDRQQVFEQMPPFQPPPAGTILPDLFSPHAFNMSFQVIRQRPTRPSATNPDGAPVGGPTDHSRPQGDRQPNPNTRVPQVGGQEPHQSDGQGPSGMGQKTHESQGISNGEGRSTGLPEHDDVLDSQERLPPGDLPSPSIYSSPFGRPSAQAPPTDYQELPAPGPGYIGSSGNQQDHFNPRDVQVRIETKRLQLTCSVNAPPYFTFESLLSQLATFLMPGFCVDLAVTRRDETCEIISHMAALKTDRQQNWQIEISDTEGRIIWLNQCMPDARLFIVPGFKVRFKFGNHSPVPAPATPAESTPQDAGPAGSAPQEETGQPPVGLPVPNNGWQQGPPLEQQQQQQAPENP